MFSHRIQARMLGIDTIFAKDSAANLTWVEGDEVNYFIIYGYLMRKKK